VHHTGGRGASHRVRDRHVNGAQGRPQVLPNGHVRRHRPGADHHRHVFLRQQGGPVHQHRHTTSAQPVGPRDRVLTGPGHGAVHHLHRGVPSQRAQHMHVVADVLQQRAGLRHHQGVPVHVRSVAHVRLLLDVRRRVPGRRAVHLSVRARNQGQGVRRHPPRVAAVVPGQAAQEQGGGGGQGDRRGPGGRRRRGQRGCGRSQRDESLHGQRPELLRDTPTRAR